VINQHLAIADVAVVGVPDERKDKIVVEAVVLKPGSGFTEAEFESWCRDRLAGYKISRTLIPVGALPEYRMEVTQQDF
jgi:acyl-CoA synthetase (AMP-forming)/AMP-acid ligase II